MPKLLLSLFSLLLLLSCVFFMIDARSWEYEYLGDRDAAGRPHGYGVKVWRDGSWHKGQWRNGLREGDGLYYLKDSLYEGRWVNDELPYGTLKYTTASGVEACYTGHFEYLLPEAQGMLKEGDYIYQGQWSNGKKHGFGRENSRPLALYERGKRSPRPVITDGVQYGIDISHYQPEVFWNELYVHVDSACQYNDTLSRQIAVVPITFVYLKATEGAAFFDNCYDMHRNDARRHGIKSGAYHFYNSKATATEQAANFISHVKKGAHELPPVLDIEVPYVRTDSLVKWLRLVEKHYGVKPIIYTNERYARIHIDYSRLRNYKLWYARYNHKPLTRPAHIHQFSTLGKIKGITTGPVDLDSLCGE